MKPCRSHFEHRIFPYFWLMAVCYVKLNCKYIVPAVPLYVVAYFSAVRKPTPTFTFYVKILDIHSQPRWHFALWRFRPEASTPVIVISISYFITFCCFLQEWVYKSFLKGYCASFLLKQTSCVSWTGRKSPFNFLLVRNTKDIKCYISTY